MSKMVYVNHTFDIIQIMGIKDFYGVIKERCPEELRTYHLSEFRGYRFAIDVSIFAYKFIRSAGETMWMNTFVLFLCTLKKHGIKSVCIFDGPNPPEEKLEEQLRRRNETQKAVARKNKTYDFIEVVEECMRDDKKVPENIHEEIKKCLGKKKLGEMHKVDFSHPFEIIDPLREIASRLTKQTMPITDDHREQARRIVDMMGIPSFQADGEAEALCAYMAVHGMVDAVLTEDTDVIAYGTPLMIAYKDFKLSDEKVHALHLSSIREKLGYSQKEMTDLCILLSCDYNTRAEGFPPGKKRKKPVGIGLKGALEVIDERRTIDNALDIILDPECLKYERCRDLFAVPSIDDVKEIIGGIVPYSEAPNYNLLEQLASEKQISISLDYISSCWKPGTVSYIE